MSYIKPGVPLSKEQMIVIRDYLYAQYQDIEYLRLYLRKSNYSFYLGLFNELPSLQNHLFNTISKISKYYGNYDHFRYSAPELINHIEQVVNSASDTPGLPDLSQPSNDNG